MLGTRRSNLSRPKRTPVQRPHQHLKMKTTSEADGDASFDGGPAIPLFYVPNSKYICYFNGNDKGNVFENLKNNSDVTSATSLTTLFSYESSSEYDGDESISLQSSRLQLEPTLTTPKSLAQIAAEKIKESRYSYRMNECDDQSKTSKSTVTTKSSSTTASSSSSSSTYPKLPSTVLKYMFKCDGGGKVGENIVSNNVNQDVMTTKRDSTIAVQETSDAGSISSMTTISTLSSRSRRRSKKFQAKRSQVLDATPKGNVTTTTVSVTTVLPSSKNKQMTIQKKKKEPITVVASMGRGGGYMIPIDEMNDLCPFDEENGVELQLVEDHDYYLSKIANEITEHQRRVERELRNNSRRTHHRGEMSRSSRSSSSGSGIRSGSRSVEITRTPSEADF